jgi:succinate dehydrogenase / fumarate reductase, membrane anchor subunit
MVWQGEAERMSTSNSSMRTPIGKVRGLGSAKSGTDHFWKTRLTAIANIPLGVAFVAILFMLANKDYAGALALVGSPFVAILLMLFLISGMIHMRLGMQVIIEDYVHSEGTKVLLLMLNTFFAIAMGLSAIFAIIKISLQG